MAHYAIQMTDGSVAIMQTIGEVTPEECITKWHSDSQAKVVSYRLIDSAVIPSDRTYRNAWTLVGKKIEHDMSKARALHLDYVRRWRAPKLAALDIEFTRALEAGDTMRIMEIAKEKKSLRDLPVTLGVEKAQTVDELKVLLP